MEEMLATIPREEVERMQAFPLPNISGRTVIQVQCLWNPNDTARRTEAEAIFRKYLGAKFSYKFFQPLNSDAITRFDAFVNIRYDGNRSK